MGNQTAIGIAESGITMEQGIAWHLQGNHYPPVPLSMVQPCIEAIDAYWADDFDLEIKMPEGVLYKGQTTAPAWAIVEQHHLNAWCERDECDGYEEYEYQDLG
jgi:hypothetical protein